MNSVILLDGGVGQEVYERAGKPPDPMWSAKVMMDRPEIVLDVHKEFMKAGAIIHTVNSYTCTPTRLRRDGKPEWFEKLQNLAVNIAIRAREETSSEVRLAGCLPPLVGSYSKDNHPFGKMKREYRQIIEIQKPKVDLFIIETISDIAEGRAATEAALEADKPVYLSYTLSDEDPQKLRSGESIFEAIRAISDYPINGLLFNCSTPETIGAGLDYLNQMNPKIPFGGYANGFTSVNPLKPGGTADRLSARMDLNKKKYATHVLQWLKKGASIVGGCCEIGPSDISFLRNEIIRKGYRVD